MSQEVAVASNQAGSSCRGAPRQRRAAKRRSSTCPPDPTLLAPSSPLAPCPLPSCGYSALGRYQKGSARMDLETAIRTVRCAAQAGARTITTLRQVVEDASDSAVERWERQVMAGKQPRDIERWAFRVGMNAARSGLGCLTAAEVGQLHKNTESLDFASAAGIPGAARRLLRAQVARQRKKLRGRQMEVALKLCEPGMSLHRAARELGMDRSNVRRSLRSALERLRSCNR